MKLKRRTVVSLIVAASCIVAGLIVAAVGLCMLIIAPDPMPTATTRRLDISESFQSVSIQAITANVELDYTEESAGYVSYTDHDYVSYTAEVRDGTLHVTAEDTRPWYKRIVLWQTVEPVVRICLPTYELEDLHVEITSGDIAIPHGLSLSGNASLQTTTGDISLSGLLGANLAVSTTTGDITMEIVSCESLSASSTTGDITLQTVSCGSLTASSSTGDMDYTTVVVRGALTCRTTTGDITLTASDAATLTLKATTGDVTARLTSPKVVRFDTTTGSVDVPHSTEGGTCDVETTTGSILVAFE